MEKKLVIYAPELKDRGYSVLMLSVFSSICLSVEKVNLKTYHFGGISVWKTQPVPQCFKCHFSGDCKNSGMFDKEF